MVVMLGIDNLSNLFYNALVAGSRHSLNFTSPRNFFSKLRYRRINRPLLL